MIANGYIGIRSPDKNGNIYGRCQRYGRFGKFDVCSPHNFNYQVFEEQIIEVLREVCKEYKNKKKLEEIAKQTKSKQTQEFDIKKQIDSFKQNIEKETRKLEVMYEDRLAGIISLEEYMKNAERIREIVKRYPNIFLHGSFSNPQDLAKVYESFDVCVTCYGTSSGNVKIAEPNKLYESIYFCKRRST